MLGAYFIPNVKPTTFKQHPRYRALCAAWPNWAAIRQDGGMLLHQADEPGNRETYAEPVALADGVEWLPPKNLPSLHDLAREVASECTTMELRRIGSVSIPLGVGPVYGCGPKRGMPSSDYGQLLNAIFERAVDKNHEWTEHDDADVERVILLAFQQCYHITDELWGEIAPYDADEVEPIFNAMQGLDPLAKPGADDSLRPLPPAA